MSKLNKYKLYDSINSIPIRNYFQVMQGEYNAMIMQGVCTDENVLHRNWQNIQAERIDYFGISEMSKNEIDLEIQKALLICEMWEKELDYPHTQYYIYEKQLESMKKNIGTENIIEGNIISSIHLTTGTLLCPIKNTAYDLFVCLATIEKKSKLHEDGKN